MSSFLNSSSALYLAISLAIGILYAWLMYGAEQNVEKTLRNYLALARVIVVALISFLLFAPLLKRVSHSLQKPIIIIAQDNSISIKNIEPPKFDAKKYQQDIQALARQLSDKYDVRTYSFGDSIKQGLSFDAKDKITDATKFIKRINDEMVNQNLGAIVIASDGIFNRGGNPIYELEKINAPLYTIALGDTIPRKDLLIANVNYNNLVYLDNEFPIEVQVQAFESKGETAKLSLSENGNLLSTQLISIKTNAFSTDITLKLKANKIGIHRYEIALLALKDEVSLKNNTQSIYVEVIDGRQKILLASAAPHPDLAIFKQAIEQNKHYEVSTVIGQNLAQVNLTSYNLALLYQLPQLNFNANHLLNQIRQQKIPLWFVIGTQTDLQQFNQSQDLLKFGNTNGTMQEAFPLYENNFTNFRLEESALNQLNKYAPLIAPFVNTQIRTVYTTLLSQKIGKINTQSPLLFFASQNDRKTAFLMGEGVWKWKLEEAKQENNYPLTYELINKTIQYLTVKDDKRKFKVYSVKNNYEENENVVLNAVLYNDSYEPVNNSDVSLKLKNEEGKIFNYTFSKLGNSYQLDLGSLAKGNYSYEAHTQFGNNNYQAKGAFYVNELLIEQQQTTANHQLLNLMAQLHQGKIFMPQDLMQIAKEIEKNEKVKTISYEDWKYEELIGIKWIFALILALLTFEWLFRKRNGLL